MTITRVLLLALTATMAARGEFAQDEAHKGSIPDQYSHLPAHQQVDLGLDVDRLSKVNLKLALDHIHEDDHEPDVSRRRMVEPNLGSSWLEVVAGSKVTRGSKAGHEYEPQAEETKDEDEDELNEHELDEKEKDEQVKADGDSVINDEEFSKSLDELSNSIKNFLHREEWQGGEGGQGGQGGPRNTVVNFPQADLLASLVGLSPGTWPNTVISVLFFGWPFLLLLLYVALIFVYPNRKSDNFFEKHMSTMIETWAHLMYTVEDNFFQFMEDVTDPGESAAPHYQKNSIIDYHDRKDVYFGPNDYYDDDGDHINSPNTGGIQLQIHADRLESPVIQSTFVDPSTNFINPVISFRPENSEPLRDQYNGDLSRLTNDYNFQNDIAQKDKHNFLNVVLEAQFQHIKPASSLADQNVVMGSVSEDVTHHPERPKSRQPSSQSTRNFDEINFNENVTFRLRTSTNSSSHFRPVIDDHPSLEEHDRLAAPRPSRITVNSSNT